MMHRDLSTLVELLRKRSDETPEKAGYIFLTDGESEEERLTYGKLDERCRAIGAFLQERGLAGERALLLYPPGLEYLTAFYGCLYGNVVAVPAYPPDPTRLGRTLPRLQTIVADCGAKLVLTDSMIHSMAQMMFEQAPDLAALEWVATDALDPTLSEGWRTPPIDGDTLAFLQYTSGSTAAPKGVMLTHANLLHNLAQIEDAFGIDGEAVGVIWLPPFHDMGLIGGILTPLYTSIPVILMSPLAFLQRPLRWLSAISKYGGTISGGPNFAYELCTHKVTEAEKERLDLRSWRLAFNGAEPIHPHTLDAFAEAFAPCGFEKSAFYPCYGLAEATLIVTGGDHRTVPPYTTFDRQALKEHRVLHADPADPNAQTFVGCGHPRLGQEIRIVDPDDAIPCPPDRVGEIWVTGGSVAQGYWGRAEATEETFHARIPGDDRNWLRTGDLGFIEGGELYVTGRRKDLIIIRGRNHYPQDIERVVEGAHHSVRRGCVAAFSIEVEEEERLALCAEVDPRKEPFDPETVIEQIRLAVIEHFDLQTEAILLLPPRSIPKTSSGKIQRHACKGGYLDGTLETIATWRRDHTKRTLPERVVEAEIAASEGEGEEPLSHDARAIRNWLVTELARRLEIDPKDIDIRKPFSLYGLDSKEAVGLSGDLETWLGRRLPPTLLYDHPNIHALSLYLAGETAEPVHLSAGERWAQAEPIAVVGLACRFPQAPNARVFWEMLRQGTDAIREVPKNRWDIDQYYDPDMDAPGKIYTRWGGFLEDVDQFDAPFFEISPREAERMDPQQRLLLEVLWEALENAGLDVEALSGSRTGVFVGLTNSDYANRFLQANDPRLIDTYVGTGNAFSTATGRLSYVFGFQGPNLAIDTACSSSLVAVHAACQSLRTKESDIACAGGVNLILSPESTIFLCRGHALSPEGRCKAFDAAANGYVRGEGCGIVVLKRLTDALADGDRVLAVIRGSAVNQDGRSNGLTAPNGLAQQAVIRRALAEAGIPPAQVDFVETHGVGTLLGDPIEIEALGHVFRQDRPPERKLEIGSVKTNIGHTESAAGIAALIKTILALAHEEIPPNLHFHEPNPHIAWEGFPGQVVTENTPWRREGKPRIAGVSSFGMSGTNAHVVIEEPPRTEEEEASTSPSEGPFLLPLSAKSPNALLAQAKNHHAFLTENPEGTTADLNDVVFHAACRRTHLDHRLAVVAPSRQKVIEGLEAFLAGKRPAGVITGMKRPAATQRVVFVFPGYGSQWIGMGRRLLETNDVFRAAIVECEEVIGRLEGWSLIDALEAPEGDSPLERIEVLQSVLLALEIALARLWQAWGIMPDAVIGHSMGEIAAAHIAGALSLEDAFRVISHRTRLLMEMRGKGATAVVGLPIEETERELAGFEGRLSVAVSNGPNSTVVSGDIDAMDAFLPPLEARDIFVRRLGDKLKIAAHSPQMAPLIPKLVDALSGLSPQPTAIPFYSTARCRFLPGEALTPDYWGENIRQPVRFHQGLLELLATDHGVFIEMSPHPILIAPIEEAFAAEGRQGIAVGSLRRDQDDDLMLYESLGTLYAHGYPVPWRRIVPKAHRFVELPPYPWQHKRFWFEGTKEGRRPLGKAGPDPLLGEEIRSSAHSGMSFFEMEIDTEALPYLQDHRVLGNVVFPAAGYVEIFLEAARNAYGARPFLLESLHFERPLLLPEGKSREVQLVRTEGNPGHFSLRLSSLDPHAGGTWTSHAEGRLRPLEEPETTVTTWNLDAIRGRCPEDVAPEAFYDLMAKRGAGYGPAFQGVREIRRGTGEIFGRIEIPKRLRFQAKSYVIHPTLLDAAFQLLGAMEMDREGASSQTFVPVALRSLRLHAPIGPEHYGYVRYKEGASEKADAVEGDLFLLDAEGRVVLEATGFRAQRLEPEGATAESETESWLFELVWRESPLPETTPNEEAETTGKWLLLSDETLGKTLAARLEARGEEVVTLFPRTSFSRIEPDVYTVDPADREHLEQALSDAFPQGEACRGVLYLWNLAIDTPAEATPEMLDRAKDLGTIGLVHLIQAIDEMKWRQEPRFWIVTEAAQAVTGEEEVRPLQAALWGMGRTLAHEHPELACTRIDLSADRGPEEIDLLLREIDAAGAEDQIAFRDGRRFVERLARTTYARMAERAKEGAKPITTTAATHPYRLEIDEPGVLDSLHLHMTRRKAPGPGEVEIAVEAAGLNFNDVMKAMGLYPMQWDGPIPLGGECAGRISAIGEGVEGFSVGDPVIGLGLYCFASHVTVPALFVSPIPEGLTMEEAAGLPSTFTTAWYALHHLGRIERGERILIHSASGGVGLAAVQIAQHYGCEIFGTAGSPRKRAFLKEIGVDHVMDSRSLDFADEIMEITKGEGVDLVLNSLSGEGLRKSLAVLAWDGRFLDMTVRDIYGNQPLELGYFKKRIAYFAIALAGLAEQRPERFGALLREVMEKFADKTFRPVPFEVFPVTSASEAFYHMAQSRHIGKIILSVDPEASVSLLPPSQGGVTFRKDGTYLITGGLGGLGLSAAAWMAGEGAGNLVLVGRRGLTEAARPAVEEIQALGARVEVMRADISKRSDVAAMLARIRETLPPLRGIVHAAGVLDDALVMNQSREKFLRVMAPKIDGGWWLHTMTAQDPLDFFVLYASAAGMLGSPGQSNYAAANAFLDGLAWLRHRQGRPAISIDWGPFSEVGGAAQRVEERKDPVFRGMGSISPEAGIEILARLLAYQPPQIGVLPLDVRQWMEFYPTAAESPLWAELAATEGEGAAGSGATAEVRQRLAQAPPAKRHTLLENYLREQIAEVLRLDPNEIHGETPLGSLGLDSLMGLELKNRIERGLGLKLASSLLWTYPNLDALVPFLAKEMGFSEGEEERHDTPQEEADREAEEEAAMIAEIEDLSEEEMAAMIEELADLDDDEDDR
ncbi:MAG: SDR family NAD(P)-dependent oxidoreductase [Deltaproteobacteria bacterium]|nr:MAG: SDR family NAD(P)-dependent oxidoreductase [Deltaproteobacteria bacterium]